MSKKMTVGVFATKTAADKAVADLKTAGFTNDQISLVAKDSRGKTVSTNGVGETKSGEGALIGAAAGGVTAAAVGAGMMLGVIPVIGPILALGPLALTLLNAAGGAAVGSLAGALIGMGLPKEDADYYEGEVAAGRYLVAVDNNDSKKDALGIYSRHGGYDRKSAGKSAVIGSRM